VKYLHAVREQGDVHSEESSNGSHKQQVGGDAHGVVDALGLQVPPQVAQVLGAQLPEHVQHLLRLRHARQVQQAERCARSLFSENVWVQRVFTSDVGARLSWL
jgi:hypothetical protein